MSSLVEVNPYPLSEAPHDNRLPEASDRRRESNLLALAWRSRWLLLLTMMIGAGIAWAVVQRVPKEYSSWSRLYVEQNLPQILRGDIQASRSANFVYQQAEVIHSSSVLGAAAESLASAHLETFRDVESPAGFLHEVIDVSVGANDEIITVMAQLPNAKDAAQIVNSVVDAYVTMYGEQRKNDAAEVLRILRSEKRRRDDELAACRKALDDFRGQHPELAVQMGDGNVVTERFSTLTGELNNTEIELLQAKALYHRVKTMYETPSQRMFLIEMAGSDNGTARDVELDNDLQNIERALTSERAQWGEGHPRVKLLKESMADLREKLKKKQQAVIESFVESLKQQYELLEQKHTELQAAYDRQFQDATRVSGLVVKLASLQEAYTRTERMCDILDERIKEVNLSEDAGKMQVSIIDPAGVSSVPSYPSRSRFLAVGIILGGLSGLGLAWLRDLLDHRLRSVDEVAEVLQLPVMGVLPHMGGARPPEEAGRVVAHAPRSHVAEAVRTLRTALHFGLAGQDARTIVVTSPSPGDGKSTVASNLAIALAQADHRVLLIDADLRKPMQHQIFEAPGEHGLSAVLADRRPVDEAILHSGVESLDLLPCGSLPNNPVELLNNGFFAELLEELKTRYDKIIIDSPPVMPVADARVISAISDSTLLVLRAERSSRRLSVAARNELWKVRAKRLGVVVNAAPIRKQGHYGHGYGYGQGYGYGEYGYGPSDDAPQLSDRRLKKSRALPAASTITATAEQA